MKLIHLSDLHIAQYGSILWDTDTRHHFDRAVELIKDYKDISGIVLTGDISHDGSQWAYDYVDNQLSALQLPIIACPGNHDDINFIYDRFKPKCLNFNNFAKIGNYSILNLNSVLPNMARGELSSESLEFIQKELEKNLPTIICLHHPPIEPGGWLNRKLLENRNRFNELLANYDNVRLVLYGHIHYSQQIKLGNILYSSSPAVGYAFDKNLPKFEIANGDEGFNIIDIDESHITIDKIRLV